MAVSSRDPGTGQPIILDTSAVTLGADFKAVSDFAAKGATRLLGPRDGIEGRTQWAYHREGLQWYDTTERRLYESRSGAWRPYFAHEEFTTQVGGLVDNRVSDVGVFTRDAARSTASVGTFFRNGEIRIVADGLYAINYYAVFSRPMGGRSLLMLRIADVELGRTMGILSESAWSVNVPNARLRAGEIVRVDIYKNNGDSNTTLNGKFSITRIGDL
ncbi:hypothetical protein D9V34_07090 [Mycetocola lacteus]|uniref:Uncharacterized protein n=1 Tax=Mycetocola lacteus TaxID=76637 RepID=A0A3L7ATX1_9MICO|nr:hypothetical protein [Mycetocola lacteus]RLP83001.1 hypothetical protein D9V34_07090 [Mycetocola lacteus]